MNNTPRETRGNIPATVSERLIEFCASGKSGYVQLDIKEGYVVGVSVTETMRVPSSRGLQPKKDM